MVEAEIITVDETALTAEEEAEFVVYDSMLRRGWQDVAVALSHIRAKRLYRKKWRTFEAYCAERLGMSDERARLLIQSSAIIRNLIETPTIVGVLPANEAQTRPLAQLPPAEQPAAWQRATEIAADRGEKVVARHVTEAVQERTGGGGGGGGSMRSGIPSRSSTASHAADDVVGDAPLTDAEMTDLSRLGGWELHTPRSGAGPERVSVHGLTLITMAMMRGEHWGETIEERTPGGWRIELGELRSAEQLAERNRELEQRGIASQTPDSCIPADWQSWRARAQALPGGDLMLSYSGVITLAVGGVVAGRAGSLGRWPELCARIETHEARHRPAPAISFPPEGWDAARAAAEARGWRLWYDVQTTELVVDHRPGYAEADRTRYPLAAWATVRALFSSSPEDAAASVVLSAFPPGPVDVGISVTAKRAANPEPGDLEWARELRTRLDAAEEGMQPDAYAHFSATLDATLATLQGTSDAPAQPSDANNDDDPQGDEDRALPWVEVEGEDGEPTVMLRGDGLAPLAAEAIVQIAESLRLLVCGEAHGVDTPLLRGIARSIRAVPTHTCGTLLQTTLKLIADDADARAATGHQEAR